MPPKKAAAKKKKPKALTSAGGGVKKKKPDKKDKKDKKGGESTKKKDAVEKGKKKGDAKATKGGGKKGKKGKKGPKKPLTQREIEKLKIQAEKDEKERLKQEAIENVKKAKLQAEENSKRAAQLIESAVVINQYDKLIYAHLQKLKKLLEWEFFIACHDTPDVSDLIAVNSFMTEWILDLQEPNLEAVFKHVPGILEVVEQLKSFLEIPPENIKMETLYELGLMYQEFQEKQQSYIDDGTFHFLEDLREFYDPELGVFEHQVKNPEENITHAIWGNLYGSPGHNEHSFESTGFTFRIPDSIATNHSVFRLLKTNYDHYSDKCYSYYAPGVENSLKQSIESWRKKKMEGKKQKVELKSPEPTSRRRRVRRKRDKSGKRRKRKGKRSKSKEKGKKKKKKGKKGKKGGGKSGTSGTEGETTEQDEAGEDEDDGWIYENMTDDEYDRRLAAGEIDEDVENVTEKKVEGLEGGKKKRKKGSKGKKGKKKKKAKGLGEETTDENPETDQTETDGEGLTPKKKKGKKKKGKKKKKKGKKKRKGKKKKKVRDGGATDISATSDTEYEYESGAETEDEEYEGEGEEEEDKEEYEGEDELEEESNEERENEDEEGDQIDESDNTDKKDKKRKQRRGTGEAEDEPKKKETKEERRARRKKEKEQRELEKLDTSGETESNRTGSIEDDSFATSELDKTGDDEDEEDQEGEEEDESEEEEEEYEGKRSSTGESTSKSMHKKGKSISDSEANATTGSDTEGQTKRKKLKKSKKEKIEGTTTGTGTETETGLETTDDESGKKVKKKKRKGRSKSKKGRKGRSKSKKRKGKKSKSRSKSKGKKKKKGKKSKSRSKTRSKSPGAAGKSKSKGGKKGGPKTSKSRSASAGSKKKGGRGRGRGKSRSKSAKKGKSTSRSRSKTSSKSKSRSASQKSRKGRSKTPKKGKKGGSKGKKSKSRSGGRKSGKSKSKSRSKSRGRSKSKKRKGKKSRSKSKKGKKGKKKDKSKSKERKDKTLAARLKALERREKEPFLTKTQPNELNLRKYSVNGGVYNFKMLHVPPQPKVKGEWTLHLMEDERIMKEIPFLEEYSDPPLPDVQNEWKNSPEGLEDAYKEEEFQKLVALGTELPEILLAEHEETLKANAEKIIEFEKELMAKYEDQKEQILNNLITINIKLPDTTLWFGTPIPVRWDPDSQIWSTAGFHGIKYDAETFTLNFRTSCFGVLGFASDRWANMPYTYWELKPLEPNRTKFILKGQLATFEFIIYNDLICLISLQDAPQSQKIQDTLLNVYMKAGLFIKTLRSHGIDIFPEFDSYAYMDGVLIKKSDLEDHIYQCMAIVSAAFNFYWSKWNNLVDRDKMVFQMQQKHERGDLMMVFNSFRTSTFVECTETSKSFSEQQKPGLEFSADLLQLVSNTGSNEVRELLRSSTPAHVETIRLLLTSVRPLSFS